MNALKTRGAFITREFRIGDISPCECAHIVSEMSDVEQAAFIQELGEIMSRWGVLARDTQCVAVARLLQPHGSWVELISTLNKYAGGDS